MHIEIISVGRHSEKPTSLLIDEYTKRLGQLIRAEWVYVKNSTKGSKAQIIQNEAASLLQRVDTNACVVILDRTCGKQYHSEALAYLLQKQMDNPQFKKIIFLIGGAYGIDDCLREKAHIILSLSQLTFPHQIVRLLLVEQLYRSMMILKNLPYHH